MGCENDLITHYFIWSQRAELNRRPLTYQASALPLSYLGIYLSILMYELYMKAIAMKYYQKDYFTQLPVNGAGNETRTRDPNLGKVVLYQLSYSRITR